MFGVGFFVGLIVGANVALILYALLFAAGQADERIEAFEDKF